MTHLIATNKIKKPQRNSRNNTKTSAQKKKRKDILYITNPRHMYYLLVSTYLVNEDCSVFVCCWFVIVVRLSLHKILHETVCAYKHTHTHRSHNH